MPFGAEPPGIQQNIPWNGHTHDRAADIDIWKVEGLAVECHKTLRPDLPDVGPEVRQQFALIRLAICTGAVQFEPIHTNADDAAGTGIQTQAIGPLAGLHHSRHRGESHVPAAG